MKTMDGKLKGWFQFWKSPRKNTYTLLTSVLQNAGSKNGYVERVLNIGVFAGIRKKKNKNDCIGILGLSYKPGSDDVRGTPSTLIIRELNKRGYFNILAYDPATSRKFQSFYKDLSAICLDDYDEIIKKADVLAITNAWKEFMDIHEKTSKPIVDCRNMF